MIENSNPTEDNSKKINLKFKKFFLLQFTRELIKNSAPEEFYKLKKLVEESKEVETEYQEETKKEIHERIELKEREISILSKEKRESEMKAHIPFKENKITRRVSSEQRLIIPEKRFPLHIQYIKPVPINKEISLGKLDPLIKDSFVKIIECYGAGKNVIVKGNMGVKQTATILSKEEIEQVINKFSEESKIPAEEGIFEVVVGRLIFLAIISRIIGSKFIIKKMPNIVQPQHQPLPHLPMPPMR